MKKILSLIAAIAIVAAAVPAAFAQAEPTIKVDGRMVDFRNDQAPVIIEDRLYVPIRRVLETMDAKVIWDGDARTVTVNSDNNVTRLVLTIDSKEITKYTFATLTNITEETLTSDVAPVIMNDRTLLPIRIVAEEIGATVVWDEETRLTSITTRKAKRDAEVQHGADVSAEDFDVAEFFSDKLPKLSITCDAEDVKKDDMIELKVKLSDIEKAGENKLFSTLTLSINYDTDAFEYGGYSLISNGEEIESDLGGDNGNFMPGMAKIIALRSHMNAYAPDEDGTIAVVYFGALNDEGGEFSIAAGSTEIGSNTSIALVETIDNLPSYVELSAHDEIYIDTTPIVVK